MAVATPREYLQIVQETEFMTRLDPGAIIKPPSANSNSLYVRIDGGNAFDMRPKPVGVDIMYGGGLATPGLRISSQTMVQGKLVTKLYASQAQFLLGWAATRIDSGRTLPWTTTNNAGITPVGDLASCTVYHSIQRSDGSYKRRAYLGTKVISFTFDVSAEAQVGTLTLNLAAGQPIGDPFTSTSDPDGTPGNADPPSGAGDYPNDPYVFAHSAGRLTIGTMRTLYSSVNLNIASKVDVRTFEQRYPNIIRFCGRESTLTAKLLYKPVPDDRTTYEGTTAGLTAQPVSFGFNNGTNSVTFNFHAQNIYKDLEDDTPVDRVYEQTISVGNYYDTVANTDLELSFT